MATANAQLSREVVQPLPTPEVQRLENALQRLARNTRSLSALNDAGDAALELGDLDAAIGFFGRALELSPDNPRAKLGMAAGFLRSERPLEALRLFAEAEAAGAATDAVEAERGLAFDLIGNGKDAQISYRSVLVRGENAEVTRRLALSQAISGDKEGFEKTLLPLLEKRDFAAFRTRAFGLAILGEVGEARAIAEAVMPRDLSAGISPYLEYMPRLTKSQQAAAANLGIFPKAADIGRDDPRIAQYASAPSMSGAVAGADSRLEPQGTPLGQVVSQASTDNRRRRPDRTGASGGNLAVSSSEPAQLAVAAPAKPEPVQAPESAGLQTPVPSQGPAQPEAPVQSQAAVQTSAEDISTSASTMPAAIASTAARPEIATFDLSEIAPSGAGVAAEEANATAASPKPESTTARSSVSDAFADFASQGRTSVTASSGAVDLSSIEIPVEPKPEPVAKPKPPEHPKRYWVQVATGSDSAALKFDWRRLKRQAPELLGDYSGHITPWNATNRLLAGPLTTARKAQSLVTALKKEGVDSFTFTSTDGQEIKKIR